MATDPIADYRDIRFDTAGKPFYTTVGGRPSYLSPIAAAEAAGLFIADPAQRDSVTIDAWMSLDMRNRLETYAIASGVTPTNPTGGIPTNTFTSQNNGWNPDTGQYDTGLNWSGLGGAITGAIAVATPAVILPVLTGSPTIFSAGAAASAASGGGASVAVGGAGAAASAGAAAAGPSVASLIASGSTAAISIARQLGIIPSTPQASNQSGALPAPQTSALNGISPTVWVLAGGLVLIALVTGRR